MYLNSVWYQIKRAIRSPSTYLPHYIVTNKPKVGKNFKLDSTRSGTTTYFALFTNVLAPYLKLVPSA
jgi:hypothetical protein